MLCYRQSTTVLESWVPTKLGFIEYCRLFYVAQVGKDVKGEDEEDKDDDFPDLADRIDGYL